MPAAYHFWLSACSKPNRNVSMFCNIRAIVYSSIDSTEHNKELSLQHQRVDNSDFACYVFQQYIYRI